MRTFTTLSAAFALAAACALPAQASTVTATHALGDAAPTGWGTNIAWTNAGRGWSFTVNTADLWVTELGIDPASASNFDVALWNVSTNTRLGAVSIAPAASRQWTWATLLNPVALNVGNTYAVVGYGTSAGATYHFAQLPANSSWLPTSPIDYLQMLYCNGCNSSNLPTNTLQNYQYGPVDIGYVQGNPANQPKPNAVPEPTSLALAVIGLVALRGTRRAAARRQG